MFIVIVEFVIITLCIIVCIAGVVGYGVSECVGYDPPFYTFGIFWFSLAVVIILLLLEVLLLKGFLIAIGGI